MIYDAVEADILRNIFNDDIKNCRRITMEDYENLGFFKKLRNSVFRIVAPLL